MALVTVRPPMAQTARAQSSNATAFLAKPNQNLLTANHLSVKLSLNREEP